MWNWDSVERDLSVRSRDGRSSIPTVGSETGIYSSERVRLDPKDLGLVDFSKEVSTLERRYDVNLVLVCYGQGVALWAYEETRERVVEELWRIESSEVAFRGRYKVASGAECWAYAEVVECEEYCRGSGSS